MKIALYGNVCNNMYGIAKALRVSSSYDVHLYLPENADFNNLPENDDPELKGNYPAWIHRSRDFNLGSVVAFWKNNIVRELQQYDLVILSSLAISLAPFLKKAKVFFYVTGGDLTVLPFRNIHRTLIYSGNTNNIKPLVYEKLQRNGIRRADKILTQPFSPFVNALDKLKIPESKIANSYFPIIFDTHKFCYRPDSLLNIKQNIRDQLTRFRFKIFHPSRIVIDRHPHMVETGQSKRNDLLLEAFAHFINKNSIVDSGLYLVDRSYGLDKEVIEYKKIIKKLDIENYVVWLSPSNSKGFTRDELVDIYSCCDMVADDYGAGWFGSICVEGFSCSKPVLSFVDEKVMQTLYQWHPFLSSDTKEGNVFYIEKCYFDRQFLLNQGELGRKWALQYHSQDNAGKLYVQEFERLLA